MNFGQALEALKEGKKVTRTGWNNPGITVELQVPDSNSKMTKPYLYMNKAVCVRTERNFEIHEDRFPLDLSCESVLAEDWEVVIDSPTRNYGRYENGNWKYTK